ncbi:MAG: M15 family metallopeptidase [Fimbriimonas sp.]
MPERKISIAEPVTELRRVKIRENGEPLVDFLELGPDLRLDRPRFHYRRETLLRQSVAERLVRANAALMRQGLRLYVVEGWRAPFIQARMYRATWGMFRTRHPEWSDHRMTRVVNRFTAPNNPRVPPPHTTGGAVDLALYTLDGAPVDMMGPFEEFDHHGFPLAAAGLRDDVRRHREAMAGALAAEGITNYPSEYWHYSYGDQGWAYRGGHEAALYGAIEPPGWSPCPEDLQDAPLEFVTPQA